MAAPKDNKLDEILYKRQQEEIKRTGKYPKSFQYLPSNFWSGNDNENVLNKDADPMEVQEGILKAKPAVLGIPGKTSKNLETKLDAGVLYILNAAGTSLYKIGISQNFNRRYRDICAASPLPIKVLKFSRMDNPHMVEAALHDRFKARRFKNDWFQLDGEELGYCFAFIDQFYNL